MGRAQVASSRKSAAPPPRTAKPADKGKPKTGKSNGHSRESRAEALADLGIVPQWQTVPELKQLHFGALVEKRTQLRDEIKFREGKVKELDEEIMAAFAVSGMEKVEWEDRPVQVVHGKSASKVVPEKLISLGVSPDVIAESTEPGKEFSYVLVGKAK